MTLTDLITAIKAAIYPNGSEEITGQILQNTLVQMAQTGVTPSGDPMHYAYVACGATWNDSTGFWELNGLTDITNDQMRAIYVYGIGCWNKSDWRGAYSKSPVRTTLPSPSTDGYTFTGVAIDGCFVSCSNLEIVQFLQNAESPIRIGSNLYFFVVNCNALTSIVNPIDVTFVRQEEMARTSNFVCPNCTTMKFKSVKYNTYIGQMSAISLDSLTYLVDNANNPGAITVTVHPTIYGYLTDQSGHPDWYALAQTAAGKNISFVSA